MSEIERWQESLPAIRPVDSRSVRQAMSDRYKVEMRVETGARLARRALLGKRQILADIRSGEPDELDVLILQSFVFSAAELIQDYMGS